MRLLFELGPIRFALTIGEQPEPEPEERPFGFVACNTLETEIVEE